METNYGTISQSVNKTPHSIIRTLNYQYYEVLALQGKIIDFLQDKNTSISPCISNVHLMLLCIN